jgi:ParB family transcriptional regulator, chromosome partitioning protein
MQTTTHFRDLSAPETDPATNADTPMPVREIPLDRIIPNPHQPRRQFEEPKLKEFTASIRDHGVLQPILVRQIAPEQYELIAGERRWRAAQQAGLTTIPAIVKTFTEREQIEIALIENLQRDDLSPVEMARAFRTLMNEFGLSQKEVGARVHKSPPVISRIVRLFSLPDTILDGLEQGLIQERHTRALLRVKNRELREDLCQQVLANRLTGEATERLIETALSGETIPDTDAPESPDDAETGVDVEESVDLYADSYEAGVERQLVEKLATQVDIWYVQEESGIIEIAFGDYADLIRITEILLTMDA